VRDTTGKEILYLNGDVAAEGFRPAGPNVWNSNFYLRLGNENDLKHPWEGIFYSLAVYNKALTKSEINRNYSLGPCDTIRTNGVDISVSVYPNPATAKDEINVEVSPLGEEYFLPRTLIRVVDVFGNIYFEDTIFNPGIQYSMKLNASHYPSGLYFLQVLSGSLQKSTKLVIQ
jgi:hypothetical protein